MEEPKNIREIVAWRYNSGFSEVREKLVDDVFVELFINDQFQDSILTIEDNLRLLAMGHFFLSLQIRPEHISPHITLRGLKAELTLGESVMALHYRGLCYKRVCSCRPAEAPAGGGISLPGNELTLAAGIKILLTRAAPALSAYNEALKSGMTLVGFVKEDRFTVFTGRERIVS